MCVVSRKLLHHFVRVLESFRLASVWSSGSISREADHADTVVRISAVSAAPCGLSLLSALDLHLLSVPSAYLTQREEAP